MGHLNLSCTLQNHCAAGNCEWSNPAHFLQSPCSSAVEHTLGKGEVSGSSPDEGIAQTALATGLYKNLESGQNISYH